MSKFNANDKVRDTGLGLIGTVARVLPRKPGAPMREYEVHFGSPRGIRTVYRCDCELEAA